MEILRQNLSELSNEETEISDILQFPKSLQLSTKKDVQKLQELQLDCNKKLDIILNLLQHTQQGFYATEIEKITFTNASFPLKTIEDILQVDESLKESEELRTKFKNFLMALGGSNLKNVVKFIVKEVYDLNLQTKINWTGREGKQSMSELIQTKIIIEVMRFRGNKPLSDCINEYKYHLQHAPDRIRSASRKERK